MADTLFVVMPVFNEEASISHVLESWLVVLRNELNENFSILVINDGSRDGTLNIIEQVAKKNREIIILNEKNSGHGQTCIKGYKFALAKRATWVFQIDSDGQCDPAFFHNFWRARNEADAVFGYRNKRDDGFSRFLISRFVALFTFVATCVWVRDPNVPYRLMRREALEKIIDFVPGDFFLANVAIAALLKKTARLKWIDIRFLNRFGGTPSVKAYSFFLHGVKLFRQLRGIKIPVDLT